MVDLQNLGEVVHSTISQFTTQAWHWDKYPEFGSVICLQSDDITIFGLVYYIKTGSSDAVRQAFAYQKTPDELQQEQPQIFAFLKTDFSAVPLGYKSSHKFVYAMPPRPPKIHAFVRLANNIELAQLLAGTGVVHALFGQYTKIDYFEELLLAFLRYLEQNNMVSRSLLMQVTEQLSLATTNDYRRLKMFMDRVGDINISI